MHSHSERPAAGVGPFLWLSAVLAALLAGGWFLWTRDTRRGSVAPEYSVSRTDDRGAAMLLRLYQKAGLEPRVWDEELTHLTRPGMLLLLAPTPTRRILGEVEIGTRGEFLPEEVRALDEWVRRGNVAVIMSQEPNEIYRGVGLIADEPKNISGTPAEPAQPGLLARGVSRLETQSQFGFKFGRQKEKMPITGQEVEGPPPPIEEIPVDRWLTLFAKKQEGRAVPQVVTAARGKGLYVAVNDVFPAGNLGLTMSDNARFMLNLAALAPEGGTIWIDEFHKRDVQRGLVTYFRERQLFPALVYGLLLLVLVFWRTGSRFGAPQPLVAEARRDSGEYVRAVAALYRNAGMGREALATVHADFRRRLAGALRMDGLTDLEEVGRRYEARTGRPALEARQSLIEAEAALARPRLTEAEAQQFCHRLALLDEALQSRARKG